MLLPAFLVIIGIAAAAQREELLTSRKIPQLRTDRLAQAVFTPPARFPAGGGTAPALRRVERICG